MESVSILTLDFLLSLYMLLYSIESRSYVIFSSISYLPFNQKCGFWDWQGLLLLLAVVLLLCIRQGYWKVFHWHNIDPGTSFQHLSLLTPLWGS